MTSFTIKGLEAHISPEDQAYITDWAWSVHRTGHSVYLRGYQRGIRNSCKNPQYLHRLIMNAPPGLDVDHINGNGLDNRRQNLRLCTRSQNNANRHRSQSKSTGVKGVHFEKCTGKWRAEIHCDGKRHTLGRFDCLEAAANAYNDKAAELFGEFARPSRIAAAV